MKQRTIESQTFKIERLDHGVLSMPNRTRNINSELDKYKAEQAAVAKEKSDLSKAYFKDDKEKAQAMFAGLEIKHLDDYASRMGIKRHEAKAEIKSYCTWQPKKAIKIIQALMEVEA